jgi:hypothetical protein
MLVSNTIASITGSFLNQGQLTLVNSTATFAQGVNNSGQLSLRNATLLGTLNNSGLLKGNGTFNNNVTSSGTLSPGFSIGTLNFVTNLTLSGTTWMEINSDLGTNDLLIVGGKLSYGGTLVVTNLGSDATYYNGESFKLFSFGAGNQVGDFTVTNLPGAVQWDTTKLDSQGILSVVIIPEPSSLALAGAGLALLLVTMRRRR